MDQLPGGIFDVEIYFRSVLARSIAKARDLYTAGKRLHLGKKFTGPANFAIIGRPSL
jgi:hypothetical protein